MIAGRRGKTSSVGISGPRSERELSTLRDRQISAHAGGTASRRDMNPVRGVKQCFGADHCPKKTWRRQVSLGPSARETRNLASSRRNSQPVQTLRGKTSTQDPPAAPADATARPRPLHRATIASKRVFFCQSDSTTFATSPNPRPIPGVEFRGDFAKGLGIERVRGFDMGGHAGHLDHMRCVAVGVGAFCRVGHPTRCKPRSALPPG